MLVAVVTTAISLVLGAMLAYPLARMRFAGRRAGRHSRVAATYLVPQPLLFIPMADIINRLELGNTLTAVMLTYPTLLIPFCAWLLMGYFKTRAARAGGGRAHRRRQPLADHDARSCCRCARPGFISAGIFAFTLAQNEFLYALIFLTKSEVRTVPVGRHRRADPRRRLLLGPAHGRRRCSARSRSRSSTRSSSSYYVCWASALTMPVPSPVFS